MDQLSQFLVSNYLRSTGALSATRSRLVAGRSRRAVTFIEYAILAGIAVGVGIFLYPFLINLFKSIFTRVGNVANNGSTN